MALAPLAVLVALVALADYDTAAAKNFTGLVICRLLLGMFEATILPSFIFISEWHETRQK